MGYFTIWYKYVTIRIKKGILAGEFEDNAPMELIRCLSLQKDIDPYEAFEQGIPVTKSWQASMSLKLGLCDI